MRRCCCLRGAHQIAPVCRHRASRRGCRYRRSGGHRGTSSSPCNGQGTPKPGCQTTCSRGTAMRAAALCCAWSGGLLVAESIQDHFGSDEDIKQKPRHCSLCKKRMRRTGAQVRIGRQWATSGRCGKVGVGSRIERKMRNGGAAV
jgi:hypothetical protein